MDTLPITVSVSQTRLSSQIVNAPTKSATFFVKFLLIPEYSIIHQNGVYGERLGKYLAKCELNKLIYPFESSS